MKLFQPALNKKAILLSLAFEKRKLKLADRPVSVFAFQIIFPNYLSEFI